MSTPHCSLQIGEEQISGSRLSSIYCKGLTPEKNCLNIHRKLIDRDTNYPSTFNEPCQSHNLLRVPVTPHQIYLLNFVKKTAKVNFHCLNFQNFVKSAVIYCFDILTDCAIRKKA